MEQYRSNSRLTDPRQGLADVLERVLDKGVVIAGDITISLVKVELLTIKIRLLIASADKAAEMGIDWWTGDGQLSSRARDAAGKEVEDKPVRDRLAQVERKLETLLKRLPAKSDISPRSGALKSARRARQQGRAKRKNG